MALLLKNNQIGDIMLPSQIVNQKYEMCKRNKIMHFGMAINIPANNSIPLALITTGQINLLMGNL